MVISAILCEVFNISSIRTVVWSTQPTFCGAGPCLCRSCSALRATWLNALLQRTTKPIRPRVFGRLIQIRFTGLMSSFKGQIHSKYWFIRRHVLLPIAFGRDLRHVGYSGWRQCTVAQTMDGNYRLYDRKSTALRLSLFPCLCIMM